MPADTTHEWVLDRLGAHIDGELDAGEALQLSGHLATCEKCAGEFTRLLDSVKSVQRHMPPLRAPDILRERVLSSIRRAAADAAPQRVASSASRSIRSWAAAAAVVAMIGTAYVMGARSAAPLSGPTADALITAHVRSLQQGHLTDIVSSDQHTVKPWFTGKLDFSPAVPRLEADGFPLVGGRLDYVGGRAVAALVYQRRAHVINVVTYPVASEQAVPPHLESHRGFQVANWSAGGMAYWVVSDLNADELRSFCSLMRDADAR